MERGLLFWAGGAQVSPGDILRILSITCTPKAVASASSGEWACPYAEVLFLYSLLDSSLWVSLPFSSCLIIFRLVNW